MPNIFFKCYDISIHSVKGICIKAFMVPGKVKEVKFSPKCQEEMWDFDKFPTN